MEPSSESKIGIVGAGPAGLAAYHCLKSFGYEPYLFEAGLSFDERVKVPFDPTNVVNGFGGAGWFSDRKLSVFPAGRGSPPIQSLPWRRLV